MGTDHPCHNIFILIKREGATATHNKIQAQISTKTTITTEETRFQLSIENQ